jgi:hypothetical protein
VHANDEDGIGPQLAARAFLLVFEKWNRQFQAGKKFRDPFIVKVLDNVPLDARKKTAIVRPF